MKENFDLETMESFQELWLVSNSEMRENFDLETLYPFRNENYGYIFWTYSEIWDLFGNNETTHKWPRTLVNK